MPTVSESNASLTVESNLQKQIVYSSGPSTFQDVLSDIKDGLSRTPLWAQFATRDLRGRFSGAALGSLWFIIMHLLIVSGLAVMYSKILGTDLREYLPYVAVGLTVWNIINGIISDGAGVFPANQVYLKQVKLPFSFFIFRINLKHLLIFFYQCTVVIGMYALLKMGPHMIMLLAIPGFMLLLLFLLSASLLAGIVATRSRDMNGLIQSALRFAFFLTPIFWDARRLGEYAFLMNFNPFYHFLEIVRAPLLGNYPTAVNYYACIGMTAITIVLTLFAFKYSMKKLAYWI
ncbi:sugar ABC transporter permease [Algimonas arctica]|uniref:Sugar ABC transporter permease n=1 Tax=Algimonas arctica TaxID=1479486 RepID=A0A8J3G1F0_9PROT|nr:ABC transporter permease [Algimonas arctica]GHA85390.1 sugar ABC transporter permease [Algimonas arctica]